MNQELNFVEPHLEKSHSTHKSRDHEIKRIVEALLFASSESLTLDKLREIICETFPIKSRELQHLIDELAKEYEREKRAFQIDQISGGYLLRSAPDMSPYIEQLFQNRRGEKLSQAATEVLAIIAYRSPITRREVEKLRGVDCSGTIISLLERDLIEVVGKKEALGRPLQYGVTKRFLQHFGLKDLQDLNLF